MRTVLHASRQRGRSVAAAALGALALLGSLLVATPAHALSDTGTGGVFVAATGRVLDTKNNIGGYNTPMPADTWRTVKVAGMAGLPDDGTVGSVSLVATVADIPSQAILYGRPDTNASTTSMGIYGGIDNDNTSFSSVLAVAADGTIQVKTQNSVRLILDVQGYYTANTDGTAPGGFVPLNGKRIVDTRSGLGATKATVAGGKTVTVQVSGTAGVPADASGAIVNLIAINTTDKVGYLTPYAADGTRPTNSFNYAGSTTTGMQAQVQLSADGKINIYNGTSAINLVVDVQGYFTAAGKSGAVFTPGTGRVYDSRATGNKIVGANETRAIQVAGQAGVPVIGSGVSAIVLSLTVAHGGQNGGYARVWADDADEPNTSAINYDYDTIRTNTITVPLGANGKLDLHNVGAATNYVFDVQGWYANPIAPKVTCPYAAGSTTYKIPAADFTCSVTAPIATGTAQQLGLTVDGADAGVVDLSATKTTTAKATVAARGGEHRVDATIVDQAGNAITTTSVLFTLGGDWITNGVSGYPVDTAYASTDTGLYLKATNDSFADDVTTQYTLTANPDGVSDPIETSTGTADVFRPASSLTAGQTYYWTARVTGTSAGVPADTTFGPWKFTASDTPIDNYCAEALLQQNAQSGTATQPDDFNVCATMPSDDQDAAAYDGMGVMTPEAIFDSTDSAATASTGGAVVRAAGKIRSKTASVHINSRSMIWKSTMKTLQYYDGASAWSKTKYRGYQGYIRCNTKDTTKESYSFGPNISVDKCANYSPKGKDILYEQITIRYGIGKIGPTYGGSMHATLTKSGSQSAGEGVGF
ncbi:hypothetical protein EDF24_1232 [Curtobacterium sp. PhB130]|uniref:hypothetical protein n=1 Tax=Curtobacterium sp. PhB130 TaxID=2485178 RepID=UPI000FAA0DCA|nr:hypothetical protein [Curtobacterium sp. PhB130]ROS75662.1 hypothetical protein EDF24_1232 [Curtobacterium sp. PhB130]